MPELQLMLDDLADDELHSKAWRWLRDADADNHLGDLPPALATYWTTQRIDFEVANGGFLQMFHNSSRELVDDARLGFVRLGLTDHVSVLDEASAIAATAEVQALIEGIWEADDNLAEFSRVAGLGHFDELDQRWWDLPPAIEVGLAHLRASAAEVEAAFEGS